MMGDINTFVQQYFTCYDGNRPDLLDSYSASDSVFSLSASDQALTSKPGMAGAPFRFVVVVGVAPRHVVTCHCLCLFDLYVLPREVMSVV